MHIISVVVAEFARTALVFVVAGFTSLCWWRILCMSNKAKENGYESVWYYLPILLGHVIVFSAMMAAGVLQNMGYIR